MKRFLAVFAPLALFAILAVVATTPRRSAPTTLVSGDAPLTVETFVTGLDTPWELAWGPDGRMWVTERRGRILRVDMESGDVVEAGSIDVTEVSESGLMGLAFHPDFESEPWVYVAHSYRDDGDIRNRVVRMRWDGRRLGEPQPVIEGLAGAGNHNGTRLAFAPDGMLMVTTGDAGEASRAQQRDDLAGKILRLTPTGEAAPGNPWQTEVWSYGHRNAQGLVFRPGTDELYATEHGPNEADEINRIVRGANYGWPAVRGACDDADERAFCAANDVVEPIAEFTPTIGIAGLDWYDADLIPGWRGSLLAVALRGAVMLRTNPETGATERMLQGEYGRLRPVLVAPDGAVYIGTSNRDGRGRPARGDDRILRITP